MKQKELLRCLCFFHSFACCQKQALLVAAAAAALAAALAAAAAAASAAGSCSRVHLEQRCYDSAIQQRLV